MRASRRNWTRAPWLAAALALATCGCGSDGEEGPEGTGGQGGATGESLEVSVVTSDPDDPSGSVPAEGAVVALDMPGGVRVEKQVGADGRVVFQGLDWSLEPKAAVTAYLDGTIMRSYVGLTPEGIDRVNAIGGTDTLTVGLPARAGEGVEIFGIATNLYAPNTLFVSATTRCVPHEAKSASFSVLVQAGEAFSLIALERGELTAAAPRGYQHPLARWAELIHDGAPSPSETVAMDMTETMPATDVSGSYSVPTHGESGFFEISRAYLKTSSVGSSETGIFGTFKLIKVSEDGLSVEYDAEYVEPAAAPLLFTHYMLYSATGAVSSFFKPGPPGAGVQDGTMPEPVTLTSSSSLPGTPLSQSIDVPISWTTNTVDAADAGLMTNAYIRNSERDAPVWAVSAPPGSDEILLPALPSGLDADEVLGSGSLVTRVEQCARNNSPDYASWCGRHSGSENITITR